MTTLATTARNRRPWTVGRVFFWLTLVVLTVIFVAPLLWMLTTSFKTNNDATSLPLTWLPHPVSGTAYSSVLTTDSATPVLRWFVNSLITATANAVLIVAVDALAAYALARLRFRGRKAVFATVVGTLFLPPFLFLIPNFLIVSKLGWLDSLWALIIPSAGGAFGVFFLRQFFIQLPLELEESAFLDGANRWQVFTRIVLPLSKPALATLALLAFLTNWNDFLWPVYVLFSPEQQTLQAGLSTLQTANAVRYDLLMAGAVVASVPVLLLYMIAQRFVIEGVSRSGLKG